MKRAAALEHVVSTLSADSSLMNAIGNIIYEGQIPESGNVSYPALVVQTFGDGFITKANTKKLLTTFEIIVRVTVDSDVIDPLVPLVQKYQAALERTRGTYSAGTVEVCYEDRETGEPDEVVNGKLFKTAGSVFRIQVS